MDFCPDPVPRYEMREEKNANTIASLQRFHFSFTVTVSPVQFSDFNQTYGTSLFVFDLYNFAPFLQPLLLHADNEKCGAVLIAF